MPRLSHLCLAALGLALVLGSARRPAGAQQRAPEACRAQFERAQVDFMAHCFDRPSGTVCMASDGGQIEMASGQVIAGAGQAAQLSGVARVALPANTDWGLASINLPDPLSRDKAAVLLVLGPAEVTFEGAATQPGASLTLTAPVTDAACEALPKPGVLVQSPAGALTLLQVDGVRVAVNGMALLQPEEGGGLRVSALTRESILSDSGTVLFGGFAASVTADGVKPVAPYQASDVAHLPVLILPQITMISLPGNATVREAVNLFSRPTQEAYTNQRVQVGLPVNVFGRSSDGNWLYARTYDGALGWLPAYYLDVHVPGEIPVLDEAPALPIRPFGGIQGYVVTRWEQNNLRAGPGESYEIVASVPLWTELALYGRSPDDQWLLVETADGVRGWVSTALISPSTPYVLEELPYPPDSGG